MKANVFLFSVLIFFSSCGGKQVNSQTSHAGGYNGATTLYVNIEGHAYDKLSIVVRTTDGHDTIPGKPDGDNGYDFSIPQEVYSQHQYMRMVVLSDGGETNEIEMLLSLNGDSAIIKNFSVSEGDPRLYLEYKNTRKEYSKYIDLYAIIRSDTMLQAVARAQDIGFSMYAENLVDITKVSDLVKEYPGSHYLLSELNNVKGAYKKRTVTKLFNSFSDALQSSPFGCKIKEYLDTASRFENLHLLAMDEKSFEPVIVTPDKYHLVIIASSTCRPCIAEIPLLKKIYADLSSKLEMTYISLDNKKRFPQWRKLLKDTGITWRSLFAANDYYAVNEKYYVKGMPHVTLVHPNGYMDVIDVRDDGEKEELYALILNK